jgi:hypothetical protein
LNYLEGAQTSLNTAYLVAYVKSRAWRRNHPVTEVSYVQIKNEIQPWSKLEYQ